MTLAAPTSPTPRLASPTELGAPPADADLPDLCALLGDPRVGATLGGTRSGLQVRRIFERWQRLWRERGLGPWVFRGRADGDLVGYAGLAPADDVEPGAEELLYATRPELWGSGRTTRTAGLALEHARGLDPGRRVVGFTLVTNRASRRVLQKLGFREVGEFERAGLPHVLCHLDAPGAD